MRHWYNNVQELVEVETRCDQALQMRDLMRMCPRQLNTFEAVDEQPCDIARSRSLVGGDQQVSWLTWVFRIRDPHVAEDRRILELPAIVCWAEQDQVDETRRNRQAEVVRNSCHETPRGAFA